MRLLIFTFMMVSLLNAGKINWGDDGKPKISGSQGKGCVENVFSENNETKECDK